MLPYDPLRRALNQWQQNLAAHKQYKQGWGSDSLLVHEGKVLFLALPTTSSTKKATTPLSHLMRLPSRPKLLQKTSLQKHFLEAINFVTIAKTLCIQVEKTRKETTEIYYKKNCFRELFCHNFGQDGSGYSQDFPEELKSIPSRTYPSRTRPRLNPSPRLIRTRFWPDFDLILTWFWTRNPPFQVRIGSKSGQIQVRIIWGRLRGRN